MALADLFELFDLFLGIDTVGDFHRVAQAILWLLKSYSADWYSGDLKDVLRQ